MHNGQFHCTKAGRDYKRDRSVTPRRKDIGTPHAYGCSIQQYLLRTSIRLVMFRPQPDRRPWQDSQLDQAQRDGLISTASRSRRSRTRTTHGCHEVTTLCHTLLTARLETSCQLKYSRLLLFGLTSIIPYFRKPCPIGCHGAYGRTI